MWYISRAIWLLLDVSFFFLAQEEDDRNSRHSGIALELVKLFSNSPSEVSAGQNHFGPLRLHQPLVAPVTSLCTEFVVFLVAAQEFGQVPLEADLRTDAAGHLGCR